MSAARRPVPSQHALQHPAGISPAAHARSRQPALSACTPCTRAPQQACAPRAVRPRAYAHGGGITQGARAPRQVLHYHDGQRYEQHHDFLVDAINPSPEHGGQRLVTFLMYLTTVEEGGETVFPMVRCGAAPAPAATDRVRVG
jgi:hypothetical protein